MNEKDLLAGWLLMTTLHKIPPVPQPFIDLADYIINQKGWRQPISAPEVKE
jgi:hypothetical protein